MTQLRPFGLSSILFGLFVLLSGCGLFSLDKSSDLEELIKRNQQNWEEKEVESYQFTYDKRIGDREIEDVQVTVRGGQIDTATIAEEGEETIGDTLTVDRLYEEIISAFEQDDRGNLNVQFNEEYSYPKRYRMEPGEETEGRGVVVTNFEVID